jgi:hypothetical protein
VAAGAAVAGTAVAAGAAVAGTAVAAGVQAASAVPAAAKAAVSRNCRRLNFLFILISPSRDCVFSNSESELNEWLIVELDSLYKMSDFLPPLIDWLSLGQPTG